MIKKKVTKMITACMMTAVLFSSVNVDVHAEEPRTTMRETEPNDSRDMAELIQASKDTAVNCISGALAGRFEVTGETSETDPDWFKVYLTGGTQYMTCYLKPFHFVIEDEAGNELYRDTYSFVEADRRGRTGYEFHVPSAGYYYVKVLGCSSSSTHYEFTIGNPTYAVSSCEIPCVEGSISMTSSTRIKPAHFDGESITVPKDAIAYDVILKGLKATSVKSARLKNNKSGRSVELVKYSWRQSNLESMNMKVESMWTVDMEYEKAASFTPTLKIYYVYPVYSATIE